MSPAIDRLHLRMPPHANLDSDTVVRGRPASFWYRKLALPSYWYQKSERRGSTSFPWGEAYFLGSFPKRTCY